MKKFKEYRTPNDRKLLYFGNPNLEILDELANGYGDLWHSSLDQGFKNSFQDIIYQTAVYWWYLNDFNNLDQCISWRVNSNEFVVRKDVWENNLKGFDNNYNGEFIKGLDIGYNLLRNLSGIPLYVKGLYKPLENKVEVSRFDCYIFYRKHFKSHHSYYMMNRKGLFAFPKEFSAYNQAKKKYKKQFESISVAPRKLKAIQGKPTVSLVIPTMKRQKYTQLLLEDHKTQTYPISQVVIVDATSENERDSKYYKKEDFPFKIDVKWQTSKGSCRARNEAIEMCTGDYIIFADDDIRIQPNFVENHIKLLQTYKAEACNGLDVMAENIHQDLSDLKNRLDKLESNNQRWKVGAISSFSNANSCVSKDFVIKTIGNDINFDGGYGEDSDYGLRLINAGANVLFNPFSANLHLKPPVGGYRFWGAQAKVLGKNRKQQPWELDKPVKYYRPVPSPTVTYGLLKHFKPNQIKEWRSKHFYIYLFKCYCFCC
ncbi:MAG: glycosyltransferase [Flavobacteriaceae bacterium]|nr:glycosyltransferase [Flavobacteriaceae bacterium]